MLPTRQLSCIPPTASSAAGSADVFGLLLIHPHMCGRCEFSRQRTRPDLPSREACR